MIDCAHGNRRCHDLIKCEQLLNGTESSSSVLAGYLVGSGRIGINHRRKPYGKSLLCKFVIHAGMIFTERTRPNHRDIENVFRRQKNTLPG
jgi:hypothetical protein